MVLDVLRLDLDKFPPPPIYDTVQLDKFNNRL